MRWTVMCVLALAACDGEVANPTEVNEEEVITTVELTLGGTTYTWSDPLNSGDPTVDSIELDASADYPVEVRFLNALEDPPEDITEEVDAESDEHQVFYGGTAPVTFTYGDTDANGLPVGLMGSLEAGAAGSGELRIVLRHLPEEGGVAVKVDGLEDTFATEGPDALPGDSDVDVAFPVTVN